MKLIEENFNSKLKFCGFFFVVQNETKQISSVRSENKIVIFYDCAIVSVLFSIKKQQNFLFLP